jgi:RNAse (barnase) inhibitor barstar
MSQAAHTYVSGRSTDELTAVCFCSFRTSFKRELALKPKPVIEIDGARFDTLDGFWDEISAHVIPGARWGRNFDAFNDILRGGFGTPQGGFKVRWVNFQRSREALGYAETARWLGKKLQHCHPDNVGLVGQDLEAARRGEGPTVAETLVDIIRVHGAGGDEAQDNVELELA